ncbi:MAG: transketolase [Oscillospiraceae bacterium]|jgi:transketolase|nr:transketolase [Oscillospiraceae bacterium]
MDSQLKQTLELKANLIRQGIIEGTFNAKSGHPGGSLSVADLFAYLYFSCLNVNPQEPRWEGRDRLVLSKGHAAPAYYAALALRGFFPFEEIKNLRKIGHHLQGHPDRKHTPGVDMSSGSLGQGISAAVGMAYDAKLKAKSHKVYAILGDGEIQEGQVWEAAMFAGHKKLDNLIAFVDNNNLQIDGSMEEVISPYPIAAKFEAFGWNTAEINSHDFAQLEAAFEKAKAAQGKPFVIIGKSVKGKGVSFMEDKVEWHGAAPNKEQYDTALAELKAEYKKLEESAL